MLDPIVISSYYSAMDVAIIGYGKMGHVIESVLVSRGHNIGLRIDPVSKDADATDFGADSIAGLDMVIEFSLPDAVLSNSRHYSSAGVPAVVGTTGWQQDRDAIAELYRDSGSFLSGSNFSIGAHVFFRLVASASNLISSLPQYDIMIQEIHHKNKKDSPSGTALTTAQNILKNHSGKTATVTERLDRRPHQHEVHVSSLRGGSMPGIHSVYIDSEFDTLELRHTARNRGGFALGAVLAAEWLLGKTGFFTVEDFIQDIFHDRGEK